MSACLSGVLRACHKELKGVKLVGIFSLTLLGVTDDVMVMSGDVILLTKKLADEEIIVSFHSLKKIEK